MGRTRPEAQALLLDVSSLMDSVRHDVGHRMEKGRQTTHMDSVQDEVSDPIDTESHEESVLGSDKLPSLGSAGHFLGTCSPCAFVHKKGCENGVDCEWCHLCDAGEKHRRQKEKNDRKTQSRQRWRLQNKEGGSSW
mmetsp:Transcript_7845/g.17011  ORF Transcript_7845/g.17011 Transcript_7845/m.17011 type:complete len:136 (+) Transcript_7845:87-494(+)